MKKKMDSLSSGNKAETPVVEEVAPGAAATKVTAEPAASEVKAEEKPADATSEAPKETTETPTAEPSKEGAPASNEPAPDSFEALFPEPRAALGAPPSWLWWVLLLIVSLVLGIIGYALTQKNLRDWLSTEPTPTPSISASPSETPTATPTTTPTVEPTATPTPTPGAVNPATVTMRVLNGTTTSGAAGRAKTILEAAGFTVRTTGNAKNQNYASTYVYYAAGKSAEAEAVKTALKDYSVTLEESALADPDNILIVIGKK